MYADINYYNENYGSITDEKEVTKALKNASRHIDILTYNRIVGNGGVSSLTPFQQEVVKEVCCQLADFETENADIIESILSQYSINGTSMKFSTAGNMKIANGVVIPNSLYSYLLTTGLCNRNIR